MNPGIFLLVAAVGIHQKNSAAATTDTGPKVLSVVPFSQNLDKQYSCNLHCTRPTTLQVLLCTTYFAYIYTALEVN